MKLSHSLEWPMTKWQWQLSFSLKNYLCVNALRTITTAFSIRQAANVNIVSQLSFCNLIWKGILVGQIPARVHVKNKQTNACWPHLIQLCHQIFSARGIVHANNSTWTCMEDRSWGRWPRLWKPGLFSSCMHQENWQNAGEAEQGATKAHVWAAVSPQLPSALCWGAFSRVLSG